MTAHDTSTKGLLYIGTGGLKRITREQLQMARSILETVLDRASDQRTMDRDLLAIVRRVACKAIDDYPPDRSCFTCDFESRSQKSVDGHYCSQWNDEIPPEARNQGCEKHQSQGLPF